MTTGTMALRKLWKPGREWTDGASFPAMVDLPLGFFTMGERHEDKFAGDTERPAHRVEIGHPLAFGRYPVTVAEYAVFSGTEPDPGEAALPVAGINWEDATAYCKWLSGATGHHYRLPSEAEWEYACGGGRDMAFPNGDSLTPEEANYMYDEQGNRVGLGARTPVGSYPPNGFGLYDMVGNIAEWTADAWHPTLNGAPEEGEIWDAESPAGLRVLRGGSWDYLPRLLRIVWRDHLHQGVRRDNVGFRVACAIVD